MAEVATAPENRSKLTAGSTLVTPDMVVALEAGIDDLLGRFDMPSDFTVPGGEPGGRRPRPGPHHRAPGRADRGGRADERLAGPAYLNRLSDLLWAMARWQEGPEHVLSRSRG